MLFRAGFGSGVILVCRLGLAQKKCRHPCRQRHSGLHHNRLKVPIFEHQLAAKKACQTSCREADDIQQYENGFLLYG